MATWRDSSGPLNVEPDLETSDRAGLGTWFGIGDFTSTPPPFGGGSILVPKLRFRWVFFPVFGGIFGGVYKSIPFVPDFDRPS